MILIILFIVVVVASLIMAWRSMGDFEERPNHKNHSYGVFLILSREGLTPGLLDKLYSLCVQGQTIFSIEKLFKGHEQAMVVCLPRSLKDKLAPTHLIELEDYVFTGMGQKDLNQVTLGETFTWQMVKKGKLALENTPSMLKTLSLKPEQKFFWQLVLLPLKGKPGQFQSTLRAMVVESDPAKRLDLVKKSNSKLSLTKGLSRKNSKKSSKKEFESYKARTLIPKEVKSFVVDKKQIFGIVN